MTNYEYILNECKKAHYGVWTADTVSAYENLISCKLGQYGNLIMSIFIYHAYRRNRPIASVIKDFVNKESRKVGESRKEIQKRFVYLDWAVQKRY